MPVNGSRGACPCSGGSGSQRAAAGGLLAVGKFSFLPGPDRGFAAGAEFSVAAVPDRAPATKSAAPI